MMGDLLLDLDFALSQIGVHNRDMELADAYYMVNKYTAERRAAKTAAP